ncbi:MAG: hypothetical protein Q9195_005933 [Heterodermia aff. obscurata]
MSVSETLSQRTSSVSHGTVSQKKALDEDDQKIVNWLSPNTFWARHQDVIRYRTGDTGKWFLETREFNGSIVVDYLQISVLDDENAVAFIYCNYKERAQQTLANLLSSLARQFISQRNLIPDTLRSSYSRHTKNGTQPSHVELLELLADVASEFSSLFLVIDALDECDFIDGTRTGLVSGLRQLLHHGAHLLFTSRPLGDVESLFKDCPQLEIRASERDIRCHVSSRLMSEPRLAKHIATDNDLLNAILDTIVARFLLAQLHIGALSRKHNKRAIRSALHFLPTEIDNTYHEAMQRIDDQSEEDVHLAKDILTWVYYAVNPLTIDELRHALATPEPEGNRKLDDEDLTDSEILVSVCAGIVTIDKESSLIRLIHYTAHEYFDRYPIIAPASAQEKTTKTCAAYLLLDDIARGPCRNARAMFDRLKNKPFLRYAASNMGTHARGEAEIACRETLMLLTNNEEARLSAFQAAKEDIEILKKIPESFGKYTYVSRLIFAASFGLTNIVKDILTEYEDIDEKTDYQPTALGSAAAGGHTDTVEVLLADGADIDEINGHGYTALGNAVVRGHEETVMALISKGASLNAGRSNYKRPLNAAVRYSHLNLVILLLEKGATLKNVHYILRAAFHRQNVKVIEKVLDQISPVEHQNIIKESLIYYLSSGYRVLSTVCDLLLQKGADANLCGTYGERPLHRAAEQGRRDIAEALLDRGIDPDIESQYGLTPLHLAI